jgi:hypothetical protein
MAIWCTFSRLVCSTKKNLATLILGSFFQKQFGHTGFAPHGLEIVVIAMPIKCEPKSVKSVAITFTEAVTAYVENEDGAQCCKSLHAPIS